MIQGHVEFVSYGDFHREVPLGVLLEVIQELAYLAFILTLLAAKLKALQVLLFNTEPLLIEVCLSIPADWSQLRAVSMIRCLGFVGLLALGQFFFCSLS